MAPVLTALLLMMPIIGDRAFAQTGEGKLQLSILDTSTGELTPARVEVFGADGKNGKTEPSADNGGEEPFSSDGPGV